MKRPTTLFFIGFFGLFLSCTSKKETTTDNILQLSLSSKIVSLDPTQSYDEVTNLVVSQIYESLFEYHPTKRPYELRGNLASRMPEEQNEGKTLIFSLKENVLYHDHPCFKGKKRTVKAQDFITAIKRLAYLPSQSKGYWTFENKLIGIEEFRQKVGNDFTLFQTRDISGVKIIDDHHFSLSFYEKNPRLNHVAALNFLSPIPMEVVVCRNNNLSDEDVGTGPFQVEKMRKDQEITLARFENYHAGKVSLEKVNFVVINESQPAWLNLLSGKLDMLMRLPKDNFDMAFDEKGNPSPLLKEKNILISKGAIQTSWYLSFNMQDPILGKKKHLREAIAYAIDWDRFIKLFTQNTGRRANSMFMPSLFGYDEKKKWPYEYNVEKAKDLIKNEKDLPSFTFDVRSTSTSSRQLGEFFREELSKIGINVNVVLNTFPAFLNKAYQGQLQLWQDGWSIDYPDAENIAALLLKQNFPPGSNANYYHNREYEKLYKKMYPLHDGPERFKILQEMENVITNDLPWILGYYDEKTILYRNNIEGFISDYPTASWIKYIHIKDYEKKNSPH